VSKKQKSGRCKIRQRRQQRQKSRSIIRRWTASISYTWAALGVLSVLLGIAGTIYGLSPKISVQSHGSLDPNDPFSTPFIITNEGTLPIHNVSSNYMVNNIKGVGVGEEEKICDTCPKILGIGGFGSEDTEPIATIEAGEKTPLFVGAMKLTKPNGGVIDTAIATNAEIVITVKYRPDWIPWRQERQWKFMSTANVEGQLVWVPVPFTSKS
jgi:hypothetical protein